MQVYIHVVILLCTYLYGSHLLHAGMLGVLKEGRQESPLPVYSLSNKYKQKVYKSVWTVTTKNKDDFFGH